MLSRYGSEEQLQTFKNNKTLLKNEFLKFKKGIDISYIKNVMREFELEWEKIKK